MLPSANPWSLYAAPWPRQLAAALVVCLLAGCGAGTGNQNATQKKTGNPKGETASSSQAASPGGTKKGTAGDRPSASPAKKSATSGGANATAPQAKAGAAIKPPPLAKPGALEDLLKQPDTDDPNSPFDKRGVPRHNLAKLEGAGIRRIAGKHLELYTDVAGQEVDDLPKIFDLAVPQWCAYFGIPAAKAADLLCTAYLMKDKNAFAAVGALPADLPPFLHGYQKGFELWCHEQPSAYYRRHLLLHEGTHAFMAICAGGNGPPWYSEGLAELCATHSWHNGQLQLRYFPKSKEEAELWGRIKIVKDDYAAGRGLTLDSVFDYGPSAHLRNEPYGWSWAAAQFLDAHPRYREAFHGLQTRARDASPRFSQEFLERLRPDEADLLEDWQLFVIDLEYGYDLERSAIVRLKAENLPAGGATVTVQANRGWQSSGVRLEARRKYQLTAKGRFQIASAPRPWPCEPNGVTLRYYRGYPLGMLLGAVRDDENPPPGLSPLTQPEPIGLGQTLAPQHSGTLYLRVNDSAAELADNEGTLTLQIREMGP